MEQKFTFSVNDSPTEITTHSDRTLLEVLREDLDLTGCKNGCGEGSCRACTVLLNGRPVAACQTEMGKVAGKEIITIEGLSKGKGLTSIQKAFIADSAMQCGYCVPGMILTADALLRTNASPTREEIVEWMNGNICRCNNYINIINAIERAATKAKGASVS